MKRAWGALLGVLVMVLAACGTTTSTEDGAKTGSSDAGAFPVTVQTQFGDVTIKSEPKRVVALGWGDAETAVALGVQPVGAADWLAFGGDGLGPWMTQRYTTAPTMLGTLDVNLEQLAALHPDLILDTRASGKQDRYDQLSKLGVPVVSVPKGATAYLTSWQQQLDLVGKALGRTQQADKLKADLDAKFTAAAAQHPEFKGKTVAVGSKTVNGYGGYVNGDGRVELMTRLGFVNSPKIQAEAGDSFSVTVSNERLDLLDADLTMIFPIGVTADSVTGDPLFKTIPSVQAGRSIVFDDKTVSTAMSSATVPGITYALDKIVPMASSALAH
ncbi:iron-siderophore ABC transporter substrate-binding protein [Amycolatopsis acidicola]|uniref:Iron-siderophore ABC transporter substrate-binding protein n=1 Tax=Amycolatopsis acidicola TaxID=2596893 RepID=A0A5N0UPX0_9PSEU|nr:iron-siderophore ABC transporter substrate-binding protein [Amycolatopsis acidicola]KAA9153171.1 iron-siderophore ABC transporter substrate-binding protein [Amycolatopsis acidicola]